MKFVIITHVKHIENKDQYFGYAPYIREMNIWLKYVDEVIIVAPLSKIEVTAIDIAYEHQKINFKKLTNFNFTSFNNSFISIFKLPIILWKIFWAMYEADHIHLRCPGNVGLLGAIVQVFFPSKNKTAKYAGNWDPNAKQPWSYRLQKWILNNTFLTNNMQVLVYGEWSGMTKNIKPFFTATYSESDKITIKNKNSQSPIIFLFAGTLSVGKQPLYAVQLIEALISKKHYVILELYGEGNQRNIVETYIADKNLSSFVFLKGNQNNDTLKEAYQKSHFVILPSKSEGWPKAIAEGMFWGCIPVATKVSCVPYMLDEGQRGILLSMNINEDVIQVERLLYDQEKLEAKRQKAITWSRDFTLDIFEVEIKKLLQA